MTSERPTAEAKVLDAAEEVFAAFGYEGASMRMIAEKAGVPQALLHYHFESKDGLYAAVFKRRSTVINEERLMRLRELKSKGPASIESILECYYQPVMSGAGVGNLAFAQLVSSIAVGSDERSRDLMMRFYDPIAREFILALMESEPRLSRGAAVRAYLFALGARAYASPLSDRASRLMDGDGDAPDSTETLRLMVAFVSAGIRALASDHSAVASPKASSKNDASRSPSATRRS